METKIYRTVLGLPWLAVPLIALRYWIDWDRLPVSMAVHFTSGNRPDGWASRENSLG